MKIYDYKEKNKERHTEDKRRKELDYKTFLTFVKVKLKNQASII